MNKNTEEKFTDVMGFIILAGIVYFGFRFPDTAKWILLGLCILAATIGKNYKSDEQKIHQKGETNG